MSGKSGRRWVSDSLDRHGERAGIRRSQPSGETRSDEFREQTNSAAPRPRPAWGTGGRERNVRWGMESPYGQHPAAHGQNLERYALGSALDPRPGTPREELTQRRLHAPGYSGSAPSSVVHQRIDTRARIAYGPLVSFSGPHPKEFMTPFTLSKSRQQLVLAVLMVCSLLIWLDNTVLSTALETLADPVRGLNNKPGRAAVGHRLVHAGLRHLDVYRRSAGRPLRPPDRARRPAWSSSPRPRCGRRSRATRGN